MKQKFSTTVTPIMYSICYKQGRGLLFMLIHSHSHSCTIYTYIYNPADNSNHSTGKHNTAGDTSCSSE